MATTVDKTELDNFRNRLAKRGYQATATAGLPMATAAKAGSARYQREELPAIAMPTANVTVLPGGERACWMQVSAEMAYEWIKHVRNQRKFKEDTGKSYGRDMAKGNWLVTHQGIAFDTDWVLMDGQHRLQGIIRSKKTITLLVVWGLKVKVEGKKCKTMDAVDRGVPRSIADQLRLNHGASNPNLMAAIANIVAMICVPSRLKKISMNEVLEILDLYGETAGALIKAADNNPVAKIRSAPVMGALTFGRAVAIEKTDSFFEKLLTGANCSSTSPPLIVRNFLLTEYASFRERNGALSRTKIAEMVLNGLHAFVEGRPLRKVEMGGGGAEYFISRQKERVAKIKALFE